MRIGLDIGSTTVKCVVLDDDNKIIYKAYERHYSQIIDKTAGMLRDIQKEFPQCPFAEITISGSAGMGLAEYCGVPFIQEVYSTRAAVNKLIPGTDVVIELGGEDAKILFLSDPMEVRMNGTCAGGTGAFIDQMATLLDISVNDMNEIAKEYDKIYTVASRCGVFAKSDIQPLMNQGARKSDVAASIFLAVVNQTVAGLAQNREIKGKVVYLGGPLTFMSELRNSFNKELNVSGICPENSLYYVALGSTLYSEGSVEINEIISKIGNYTGAGNFSFNPPLFASKAEYDEFMDRHKQKSVKIKTLDSYEGDVYLGIDAGSTTVKLVVISPEKELLYSKYLPNSGNPVPIIKSALEELYELYPKVRIISGAVTGYGEEIIKNAFCIDFGVVETIAHFTAAKELMPDVEFVIDIGGQDIKCFRIRNGVIDNIFLNEACSSGCGSFLQMFANALGYSIEEFAEMGLFAQQPVDLGSRCTVFMNSSVKQAQKDGATIEDISAGLSISVVKNALYKVIRVSTPEKLGRKIVVQGGTFLNDAVLRAFEKEMGIYVVRPNISGLMGAYGAALYAMSQGKDQSDILDNDALENFRHKISAVTCGMCSNKCKLTVNMFGGGRKYIGGNRCERPITVKASDDSLNIYDFKLRLLEEYMHSDGPRGKIGIPMGLNIYEMLPFWHKLFTELGFGIETSPFSSRKIYIKGQQMIPSDTVCFPAKIIHGHIQTLIDNGLSTIFYPCMTYNIDEGLGDNHYNCPVVAYYPEVISSNMKDMNKVNFIKDYFGIHRKNDFPIKFHRAISKYFKGISLDEVKRAAKLAYEGYDDYFARVRAKGNEIIEKARKQGKHIIVLSGRPYHVDPEINHGIDRLIMSCGAAVISEDSISYKISKFPTNVLNQWTYHSRLYAAAKYVCNQPDMDLVQLVSFGCGVDAITTDEVREILESFDKIYTQIKIDEITNLGAVKIRLRSLFAAIGK